MGYVCIFLFIRKNFRNIYEFIFRVNVKSDPLVKATQPLIKCKGCGKMGHTKRSCKVGLAFSEDDVMVNNILITVTSTVTTGAGGDNNVEDVSVNSGVTADENKENDEEEEDYEDDTDEVNTYSNVYDSIQFAYEESGKHEDSYSSDED